MNVCSSPSPDTGGSLCPDLAQLSRPAASDLRDPEHCTSDNRLREPRDRRGYLVFLGKLHRQECRTTAIGERGLDNIITLLDSLSLQQICFPETFPFHFAVCSPSFNKI